jgi:hypothetical protein
LCYNLDIVDNKGLSSLRLGQDINARIMDHKKLRETRQALQQHKDSIREHGNTLQSITEKISVQAFKSNSRVEVIMGTFLQKKPN